MSLSRIIPILYALLFATCLKLLNGALAVGIVRRENRAAENAELTTKAVRYIDKNIKRHEIDLGVTSEPVNDFGKHCESYPELGYGEL